MKASFLGIRTIMLGFCLLSFAAMSVPASADTVYDTNFAGLIKGPSSEVRAKLLAIAKASQAQMKAIFAKYGIDPNAKPDTDKLMKASRELEAVGRQERQAVQPLLKPEEMAQYNALVAETTKRVRDAAASKDSAASK